jgi:hypothetical protein
MIGINPSWQTYLSKRHCPRHGTATRMASSGECVTCFHLRMWRERGDRASDRAAIEALASAASTIDQILTMPSRAACRHEPPERSGLDIIGR